MSDLEQIVTDLEKAESISAQRRGWNPSHVGEIDIRIATDGNWYHEGRPFQRKALVKLFAGILQKQNDDYFLVTPVEKLRIKVDDAPFVATLVETVEQDGKSAIVFTTNLDDRIILDNDHPIRIVSDPETQAPRPYVHFRDGIEALIGRNAFYALVCLAEARQHGDETCFSVNSLGHDFDLGCFDSSEI